MNMVFNFKMSVDDYRKMMFYKTFGISVYRRIFIFLVWIIFSILLLCDIAHIFTLTRVVHVCSLLIAVAVPAAFLTTEINIWQYKDAYLAGMKAERQIVINEEGLTFRNKSTDESGFNSWSDVTKMEEMKHMFLIQLGRKEAVILPKRSMGGKMKVQNFIDLVNRNIPDDFYPMDKANKIK